MSASDRQAERSARVHEQFDALRAQLKAGGSPHTGEVDSCPHCRAEREAERVAATGQMQW